MLIGLLSVLVLQANPPEFVGIPDAAILPHYRPQQQTMWCWAACTEMALSYQGIKWPQANIVQRAIGLNINIPGNPQALMRATNGIFLNEEKKQVVSSGQMILGPPIPHVLYTQLKRKKPVILAYQQQQGFIGHAVLLTGMDFNLRPGVLEPEINPLTFHIWDPFSFRVVQGPFGEPQFVPVPELRKRVYNIGFGPDPFPGQIVGAILIEGELR